MPDAAMIVESAPSITNKILAHYDANARDLPWRSPPGAPAPDAYAVWLSEIMLQQTTVVAVKPYFESFLARWPTVEALAAAEDSTVMSAWAGLGYYARARNLLACARTIARDYNGIFPQTAADLRLLPGIGPYTAAAIAAIAYGERAAVVDGNVERVITRLYALDEPLPSIKADIAARVDALTPAHRPGDFAQAMMDLGATLCSPRNPACGICPVALQCEGRTAPQNYPNKPRKAQKPARKGTCWWVENDNHVFLIRRPASGLLGGMRAWPSCDWGTGKGGNDPPCSIAFEDVGSIAHVFTHFSLELSVLKGRIADRSVVSLNGEWWPIDRLEDAGLPSLFAKASARARGEDFSP